MLEQEVGAGCFPAAICAICIGTASRLVCCQSRHRQMCGSHLHVSSVCQTAICESGTNHTEVGMQARCWLARARRCSWMKSAVAWTAALHTRLSRPCATLPIWRRPLSSCPSCSPHPRYAVLACMQHCKHSTVAARLHLAISGLAPSPYACTVLCPMYSNACPMHL